MQIPAPETLPGSKLKLVFTVTPEEAKPYIDEAVRALGEAKPIPGFRPGKAPYAEIAKACGGEMRIWEAALERIVKAWYMRAVLDQDIDTVGSPEVQVDQLTPGSDIKFTVIAPIAPNVASLADYHIPRVTFTARQATDEDVTKALEELRRMQRKEVVKLQPATKEDLIVIDLEMKRDHVILEGGTAQGYRVYLAEEHYIPGFTEKLIGMSTGEERTFTLAFPEGHYQKHLSGKSVDFTAKAKQIFALELPELDDAFAKSLGQETLDALKSVLKSNIQLEETERAKDKSEIELLEKLVDASGFSDVPELLVNEEVAKMLHELEHAVEDRGMNFSDYLASIKKSKDELKLDFAPQAIRRIKTATLIKEIAKKEQVRVTDEDLDREIDRILSGLRDDDKDTRERVSSPEYREYVAILLRNQKTLDLIKRAGIEGYPATDDKEKTPF
ncbi:trigger factor [Patescibacteria group bacterium]|nr:trigger factor [Patescibacteria group bacterium]MDL1953065.1 trigger factor [Candidatus Uhrbacteria bacterium UHB]RIL00148.1 MAG: trigger factor [Candidatus Uhrbacteria bacterium]